MATTQTAATKAQATKATVAKTATKVPAKAPAAKTPAPVKASPLLPSQPVQTSKATKVTLLGGKAPKQAMQAQPATKAQAVATPQPRTNTKRAAYTGKTIQVLDKGVLGTFRAGSLRLALMQAIVDSKTTDQALGRQVAGDNGKQFKVGVPDLVFAAAHGLVAYS